ncbi:class I SAM-dependent methyltransferase, partial [Candidatus Woesearchaeota archaeon]|nr:class I SAM-dependent methyltransferase [Candidatus Woesearchaeota archaeon]
MPDYRNNAELYEAVEDIPGEKAMFQKAAKIIMDYAKRNSQSQGISILDLCCGTSAIIRSLQLDENKLIRSVTGVDINQAYLDFLTKKCDDITMDAHVLYHGCGAETKFVITDAVDYTHPSLVDIIIASSAYHHIEDERKLRFLEKVRDQL